MDSPKVVDIGLSQMLSLLVDHNSDMELDVFFFIPEILCYVNVNVYIL